MTLVTSNRFLIDDYYRKIQTFPNKTFNRENWKSMTTSVASINGTFIKGKAHVSKFSKQQLLIPGKLISEKISQQVEIKNFKIDYEQYTGGYVFESNKLGYYIDAESLEKLEESFILETAYLYDEIFFSEKPKAKSLQPLMKYLGEHIL